MALMIVIVLVACFYFSRSPLAIAIGKWISDHLSIESVLGSEAILNMIFATTTALIAGIGALIRWCFKKEAEIPLYLLISSNNDIPCPLSSIRATRDEGEHDALDISLMRQKSKSNFRYVYAKAKNTGDCTIEKCLIAKRQIPCSLNSHDEYKLRLIVPEPTLLPNLRRVWKRQISYRLEDGMSGVVKGKYVLNIDTNNGTVDFVNKRCK